MRLDSVGGGSNGGGSYTNGGGEFRTNSYTNGGAEFRTFSDIPFEDYGSSQKAIISKNHDTNNNNDNYNYNSSDSNNNSHNNNSNNNNNNNKNIDSLPQTPASPSLPATPISNGGTSYNNTSIEDDNETTTTTDHRATPPPAAARINQIKTSPTLNHRGSISLYDQPPLPPIGHSKLKTGGGFLANGGGVGGGGGVLEDGGVLANGIAKIKAERDSETSSSASIRDVGKPTTEVPIDGM